MAKKIVEEIAISHWEQGKMAYIVVVRDIGKKTYTPNRYTVSRSSARRVIELMKANDIPADVDWLSDGLWVHYWS